MSDPQVPPVGSVCHLEIPAPDLDAAQRFYGAVFGWTFHAMGPEYVIFQYPGGGGGLDASLPVGDGGAVPVLAVPEVAEALGRIDAAGGKRLTEKTEIGGGHGFCAYFRDPLGNKMGVWSRA